jgi:hypothetical protein
MLKHASKGPNNNLDDLKIIEKHVYVCRTVITNHGGDITGESTPGKGTVFT